MAKPISVTINPYLNTITTSGTVGGRRIYRTEKLYPSAIPPSVQPQQQAVATGAITPGAAPAARAAPTEAAVRQQATQKLVEQAVAARTIAGIRVSVSGEERKPEPTAVVSSVAAPPYSVTGAVRAEVVGWKEALLRRLGKKAPMTLQTAETPAPETRKEIPDFVKAGGNISYRTEYVEGRPRLVVDAVTVPKGWSASEVMRETPQGLQPELRIE